MNVPTSRPVPVRAKDRVVKAAVAVPEPVAKPVRAQVAKAAVAPKPVRNSVQAGVLKALKLSVPRLH